MHMIPRHVYFERRRLTLAGVLAFVAGYALYAHVSATVFGMPLPLFTGLCYAGLVVPAAAGTSYFMPNLRRLIEGVAVSRLGFALWVVVAQAWEIAASPLASATIVVGGAFLLLQLGGLINRLSQRPTAKAWFASGAARASAVVGWLDNAAARGDAAYPAAVSNGAAHSLAELQDDLVAA